jgi:hypothetical protein
MRMMLRAQIPAEQGNEAIRTGTIQKLLQETMDHLKPEAAYFVSDEGQRGFVMFFDMEDASAVPPTVEPLFLNLNANIELTPAMDVEDLTKGLAAIR